MSCSKVAFKIVDAGVGESSGGGARNRALRKFGTSWRFMARATFVKRPHASMSCSAMFGMFDNFIVTSSQIKNNEQWNETARIQSSSEEGYAKVFVQLQDRIAGFDLTKLRGPIWKVISCILVQAILRACRVKAQVGNRDHIYLPAYYGPGSAHPCCIFHS